MSWADFPDVRQSVGLLRRSLERERLGHAYLFTGENPALLENIARELAITVNCTNPPSRSGNGLPTAACGTCSSCRRISRGMHPDVHWLRAESKLRIIRVEQVRTLANAIQLKPGEARFKVGILVGADRLNAEAANAFLKTLEEPPPQSLLILLSTEPERLIETILSRCLRLSFPAPESLDEDQLQWLREFVGMLQSGPTSLLTRYRLLDILSRRLAQIRRDVETQIEARSTAAEAGEADSPLREDAEAEVKAAVEAEFRRLRAQTLRCLQLWLRDLWLTTLGQPDHLLAIPGLSAATRVVAARLDPQRALANLNLLEDTQRLLHTNIQEGLPLEVALLRLNM